MIPRWLEVEVASLVARACRKDERGYPHPLPVSYYRLIRQVHDHLYLMLPQSLLYRRDRVFRLHERQTVICPFPELLRTTQKGCGDAFDAQGLLQRLYGVEDDGWVVFAIYQEERPHDEK